MLKNLIIFILIFLLCPTSLYAWRAIDQQGFSVQTLSNESPEAMKKIKPTKDDHFGEKRDVGNSVEQHHWDAELIKNDPEIKNAYKNMLLTHLKRESEIVAERKRAIISHGLISYFIFFITHCLFGVAVWAAIREYRQAFLQRKTKVEQSETCQPLFYGEKTCLIFHLIYKLK